MSKSYEVMYIVKPIANEEFEAVVAKINKVITDNNGTVEKTDRWGKRRLAYSIGDCEEGLYVLVSFTAPPSCIRELDRICRIEEEILRHMILGKECC